jgi:hypothetical protein
MKERHILFRILEILLELILINKDKEIVTRIQYQNKVYTLQMNKLYNFM